MGSVIFIILGSLIINVISITADTTKRTNSQLEADRVARDCFSLIGKDLEGLSSPYKSKSDSSLQLLVNPSNGEIPITHSHSDSLFFQSSVARSRKYGNLAIVGYFIIRDIDLSSPTKSRLQLRRIFIDPESPTKNSDYNIYSQNAPWLDHTLVYKYGPETWDQDFAAGQEGWVADGVLGMWVRCLDKSGNPILIDRNGLTQNGGYNSRKGYRTSTFTSPPNSMPSFIEIGLVCCSPFDVPNIRSLPTSNTASPQSFYSDIINFKNKAKQENPNIKSIESFTRLYKIHNSLEI